MPHCSWVPSSVPHSILDKLDAEIEKEEFGVDISDQYSVNHYVFSVPQSDDNLDDEIEEEIEEEEEEKEEFGVDIDDSLDQEIEVEEFGVSEYLETRTYYGPMCDDEEQDACFICAYEYEDEDIIGTLHCGHDFHADCANKWLLTRKKTCPVCSDPVLPIQ
ncbi:PREDICTED: E3 ubiquitin ligase BIG BROTHER-related-like [Nicotiana attenuata]|uniref:RING-type E3 ubiquitin transferase n=1 Tax=Nicotiana attenuata TaxID=49451 RepID=A0A1J6JSC3_NICAT|nr:PREDICTED: E3 ubiquitin ligase BIG BROTHER-related-like [Nicotiana attenuata]XP_019242632.1 PREDICTED: E3 ubiquitin ligase BIG BROTHER-related-like [Nicotiana attenuata]OIT08850.1 putative e3 ubiquitin-protein ligase hip1 [Nicotiana attenuata]OIT20637.1 putative e3 ubiquitin-protein ligase hip1 [Nicotiana attenuata]OIT37223.1 putative e3 ubiquitin-protein ligase hip1 [Nicotiana attenuata]